MGCSRVHSAEAPQTFLHIHTTREGRDAARLQAALSAGASNFTAPPLASPPCFKWNSREGRGRQLRGSSGFPGRCAGGGPKAFGNTRGGPKTPEGTPKAPEGTPKVPGESRRGPKTPEGTRSVPRALRRPLGAASGRGAGRQQGAPMNNLNEPPGWNILPNRREPGEEGGRWNYALLVPMLGLAAFRE